MSSIAHPQVQARLYVWATIATLLTTSNNNIPIPSDWSAVYGRGNKDDFEGQDDFGFNKDLEGFNKVLEGFRYLVSSLALLLDLTS